jgi:hypothetical protein
MIVTTSINIARHVTTEVENNLTGQYSYEDRCRNNVLRDMGLYAWEALILLLSLKVCMYTCMYVYIYVYVYVYICIFKICRNKRLYVNIFIDTNIHTYVYKYIYV